MSFPPLKNNNLYAQWNEYLCFGAIHKDDQLRSDDHIELAGLDGEETSWRNTLKYYGFIVGTLPGFDFTAPAILA